MATLTHDDTRASVESRESPLGCWTIARWRPPRASALFGAIEHIWYFDGTLAHARERVFPDGCAELIVQLDRPHSDGDARPHAPFPAVCINGLRTRPSVVVAPEGRCRVLGIGFDPAAAGLLLRTSMKDLVDVTIDLRDGLGADASELGERCAGAAQTAVWNSARNARATVVAAQRWLAQRFNGDVTTDPEIAWVAAAIRNAGGNVSVDDAGSAVGLSRARLAQRFLDCFGVRPKRFARMLRFSRALSLLGRDEDTAAVAAEAGYYDQAHMYRDFTEFAGMTPGAFLGATRYPSSGSVAEP